MAECNKNKLQRSRSYNPPQKENSRDSTKFNNNEQSDMAVALDLRTTSVHSPTFASYHEYDSVYSLGSLSKEQSRMELQQLEDQLHEFHGKILQRQSSLLSRNHDEMINEKLVETSNRNNHDSFSSSSDDENTDPYTILAVENRKIQDELNTLRREYNRVVLESAFLAKENQSFKERLKDEANCRKKLRKELQELIKNTDRQTENICINGNTTENTQHLLEQLNACREDFFEERSEKEQYKIRNSRLEKELEDAKKLIEQQNRKLVLYSNYFKNPIKSELCLPVSNSSDRKRHSDRVKKYMEKPMSRNDLKFKITNDGVKYETPEIIDKNGHIIEACLSNSEKKCRNIRRESCTYEKSNKLENFSQHHKNKSRRSSLCADFGRKNIAKHSLIHPLQSTTPPLNSPTRLLHSPILSSVSSAFTFSELEMGLQEKYDTSATSSTVLSKDTLCHFRS